MSLEGSPATINSSIHQMAFDEMLHPAFIKVITVVKRS